MHVPAEGPSQRRWEPRWVAEKVGRHGSRENGAWNFILRAPRQATAPLAAPLAPPMKRPVRRRRKQVAACARPISTLISAGQVARRENSGPTPPSAPAPFSVWNRAGAVLKPWIRKFPAGQAPPKRRGRWPAPRDRCVGDAPSVEDRARARSAFRPLLPLCSSVLLLSLPLHFPRPLPRLPSSSASFPDRLEEQTGQDECPPASACRVAATLPHRRARPTSGTRFERK